MEEALAAGEKVGVPHPEVLAPGADATCSPSGKESLNATPLNPTVLLGLVSVNVRVTGVFCPTVPDAKLLAIVGAATTVRLAEAAVVLVPPLAEETVLLVLAFIPAVVLVTLTLTMQVLVPAIVPPEKEIEVALATGEKMGEPQPEVP